MIEAVTDKMVIEKAGKEDLVQLCTAIEEGEALGLQYIRDSSFLQVPSGEAYKQSFVNLAIDYILANKCEQALINYNYRYDFNASKNCKHIELYRDDFKMTHSSCNHFRFPRSAKFREILCTNQLSLFGEVNSNVQYGILVHSSSLIIGQKPKIALGIPDANCKSWCNYIPFEKIQNEKCIEIVKPEQDVERFSFEMRDKLNKIAKG